MKKTVASNSVVDLVVYLYILFCFFLVLVGLLFSVVNPIEVYTGFSKPRLCNLIGQFEPSSL